MIFLDWSVIVKNSQTRTWLNVEVIGGTGMVIVMDDGGEEEGKNLQVRHPILVMKVIKKSTDFSVNFF